MADNIFLAARPAPDQAVAIAGFAEQFQRAQGLKGNVIKPGNLHVTLVEFSKVRETEKAILEKVVGAGKRIGFASFDVMFDRAMSFSKLKEYPLVLSGGDGIAGLTGLQQALIQALHKEWLKIAPNPRYTPHMTLLYADRKIEEVSIPPLRWTVAEFVFLRSLPGKSTHVVLDRWPLLG